MAAPEVTSARNAVLELLGGALRPSPESSTNADLRHQVDRWIQKNLGADLTLANTAATHAISVRTLSRLYRSGGETFGCYVRRLRLRRARMELMTSDDAIATIAYRWRFSDASHFTRRFVDEFGSTPSTIRMSAKQPAEIIPIAQHQD
jgi:AraC-like DNA-binding protein